MRIGNLNIPVKIPLYLAPMAGYTNIALRESMSRMGADIVCTELASAAALSRAHALGTDDAKKTLGITRVGKTGISGIQLFGANREEITGAIKFIEAHLRTQECRAKFIDLNMGCPATKVCTIGAGSELLKDKTKLEEVVDGAVRASSIPITVKMRLMPSIDDSMEIARMLERKGICAISVHGRTQKQKYKGFANWGAIGQIRNCVDIPIIGNGDVKTVFDAKKILKISNCDAVMVGRAALENPFVFMQIKDGLCGRQVMQYGAKDKLAYLRDYIGLCKEHSVGIVDAKERATQLIIGIRDAARIRDKMTRCNDFETLLDIYEQAILGNST